MQVAIREFIRHYNQRYEATVLLTSHYMDDVTALCNRVIVIDKGRIIHDGDLRGLIKSTNPDKLVSFTLKGPVSPERLGTMGELLSSDGGPPDAPEAQRAHASAGASIRIVLRVKQAELRDVVSHALSDLSVDDLSVEDPPLEDVLRQLFTSSTARPQGPAGAS
jgi:ABC-2 type transport system ATP-binding protein